MKTTMPETDEGWERLASGLLRAHLGMAHMSLTELSRVLATMGSEQSVPNISTKLKKGRFSATFFLQVLAAAGARELTLPEPARERAGPSRD